MYLNMDDSGTLESLKVTKQIEKTQDKPTHLWWKLP